MRETFILGADDPEMEEITRLLTVHELDFCYAAVAGVRCHPGNAYRADSVVFPDESQSLSRPQPQTQTRELAAPYTGLVFVECRPHDVPLSEKHARLASIDHHEEGDPGYSLGPADFWAASSLGQVVSRLIAAGKEVECTHDMLVLAAMDHCRQAAIRGECPGVSAEEVLDRRVASISERHQLSIETVKAMVADFAADLQTHEPIAFGNGEVVDYTHRHLGVGYSPELLCAQTALDMNGLAALARSNESPDPSDEKIMLTGHATPHMVEHFMRVYAPAKRLVRIFGVPARSYAGGYITPVHGVATGR